MVGADEALERLVEGNKRFVNNVIQNSSYTSQERRDELLEGQNPFAIVLGCSDSRVPSELVFDQGLGDLFVIRVAGNIVAPSQVGSVEFAAEEFGVRLVVVLGHSSCGAVVATLDQLRQPVEVRSKNIRSVVDRIKPAIETLVDSKPDCSDEELLALAIRSNIRASVSHLKNGSSVLEELIKNEGLLVVGAEYSLETGEVKFLKD